MELSTFADFSCFSRAALGFVLQLLICNLFSFDCYIFSHHNGPHFVMCSHPQGSITVLLCSCVQDRQDMTEPVLEILQAAHGMSDTGSSPSACGAAVVLLLYRKNLHGDYLIAVQSHLRSILNKSEFRSQVKQCSQSLFTPGVKYCMQLVFIYHVKRQMQTKLLTYHPIHLLNIDLNLNGCYCMNTLEYRPKIGLF